VKKIIETLRIRFFIEKENFPDILLKIMKIFFLLVILKLIINNFYVPKEFYWDRFDFDFKKREYFLEWEDGCKIIEIGKKGKYYYGRVISVE
jgi:hypothetical protein